MRIKIDLESDSLTDGLYIHIDDNQQIKVYKSWIDIDEGKELEVSLKVELLCPSCDAWTKSENWTGKYICQNCAWDSLETEAYGETLE